jgi:hypothetical protein
MLKLRSLLSLKCFSVQHVQKDIKLMKETDITNIIESGSHFLPRTLYGPTLQRVKLLYLPSNFFLWLHICKFLSKFAK